MFLLYLEKNLAINYLWVTRYSIQATINEPDISLQYTTLNCCGHSTIKQWHLLLEQLANTCT